MENNNFIKYIFAAIVIFLVGYTFYILVKNDTNNEEVSLDQTSTVSTIQTDLRLAIAELDTINPILSHNRNVQEITKIIYEPLVTLNENYKLEYCLAEEIAKIDDVNYVIKMRKGVLWENNTNFTAYDVKFTIDMIKDYYSLGIDSIYAENLKYVVSTEAVDDTTLKIVLSQEVPFFEYNLTFPVMCESYYAGEDFKTTSKAPIGTGMFKIAESANNVIKLVRNDNYWNSAKEPTVQEVYINLYATIGEVYNAFKSGDVDLVIAKNANVEQYIGTLGYNKVEYKAREYDFLALNTSHPILSNINVRKALSLIVDKNALVATCFGSSYISSNFSLDMGNWLYTKDVNIEVDTEQAKQILINDGWIQSNNTWNKNVNDQNIRLAFTLTVNNNNATRVAVAENIKTQFESFGIPITIRQVSAESYSHILNNREYEIVLAGLELGFSPSLETFFGNGNIANYQNQEIADIMNVVKNTADDNVLYEKYARLYEIYLEEVPYIGLYRNTNCIVYNQNLVGNITPNVFNVYHNIEKWYRQ